MAGLLKNVVTAASLEHLRLDIGYRGTDGDIGKAKEQERRSQNDGARGRLQRYGPDNDVEFGYE